MSVEYDDRTLRLSGFCAVEEAETVLEWILRHPQGELDLSQAEHVHTAVVQVLLAAGKNPLRLPEDSFLRRVMSNGLPPEKEKDRHEDSARCR